MLKQLKELSGHFSSEIMLNHCNLQQLYVTYLLHVNPRNSPSSSNNYQIYLLPPTTTYNFTEVSSFLETSQTTTKPLQTYTTHNLLHRKVQPAIQKLKLKKKCIFAVCFYPGPVFSLRVLHSLLPAAFLSEAHSLSLTFDLRSVVSFISIIPFSI